MTDGSALDQYVAVIRTGVDPWTRAHVFLSVDDGTLRAKVWRIREALPAGPFAGGRRRSGAVDTRDKLRKSLFESAARRLAHCTLRGDSSAVTTACRQHGRD